jgi:protein-S-isoprenylcysteine O-methyltransferase Ste14
MNVWVAKGTILLAAVAMVVIRAPHGQRSRTVKVAENRRGRLEAILLTFAWVGYFVPLVWALSPALAFADYSLRPIPFALGVLGLVTGLWVFHRSHVDLGTNWSITLQIREAHTLVTEGVYRRIRHPMYAGLLLYSAGQALAVPNWIAGPSYLFAMALLFALRVAPEERMMRDRFGAGYEAYMSRTERLVPGIW